VTFRGSFFLAFGRLFLKSNHFKKDSKIITSASEPQISTHMTSDGTSFFPTMRAFWLKIFYEMGDIKYYDIAHLS
jgi:hypothetical protein